MNSTLQKPFWRGLSICFALLAVILQQSHFTVKSEVDSNLQANPTIGQVAQVKIHLPAVLKNAGPMVYLTSIWTSDETGNEKQAFLPGEPIRFYASGLNTTNELASAELTWSQNGPCGAGTVNSGTMDLEKGTWMQFQSITTIDCIGIYTYTLQVNYQNLVYTLETPYVVDKLSRVAVSNKQAFDKCNIMTTDQMQVWWDQSPYRSVNIYIGGIMRGCANSTLDAVWVHTVTKQGWSLIPTWVGPQAPCSRYSHRISANATTAYQEGRREAESASNAAAELGLSGNRVIYYDMEGFSGADLNCRNAVKSFIRGWVERLHELGARAGAYGSPCSSYVADWATINPMPDNVWIAAWKTPYAYNPDATVWGVSCLSDTLWANHQRIRQYTGGHVETWGGMSFSIDSNAVDGEVTILPHSTLSVAEPFDTNIPSTDLTQTQDMQPVSPDYGWVLANQRLLWTDNAGAGWRDITPGQADTANILAVSFIDNYQGWLILQNPTTGKISILRTADDISAWESYSLPESTSTPGTSIQDAHLNFLDRQNGWLSIKFESSSNFSIGTLFRTTDGGKTWTELTLPFGGPVRFIDGNRGWIAGGTTGSELFRTTDGGSTWKPQNVIPPGEYKSDQLFVGLPSFLNDRDGSLTVTIADPLAPRAELYETRDGGETWRLASTIPLDPEALPGSPLPSGMGEPSHWFVAAPGTDQLYAVVNEENGTSEMSLSGLPEGVVKLEFITSDIGWAQVQNGACSGDKTRPEEIIPPDVNAFQCEMQSLLFRTSDGGQTWVEITP